MLQRVSAAKVVHQVRGITSLGGDDGLAKFADDIGLTMVRLIISKKLPYWRADFSSFIYNFLVRCGTHFLLMKRNPADQHETTIWRNQTDTVTWLAVIVSLPTLLGYQRASAFVNATKLASQPLFSSDEEYKISNVLSNTFFIDIDHVSIAIHIVIVLSPSPTLAWSTKPVLSRWSIFVAIANNTLYGSKLCIFLLCQK